MTEKNKNALMYKRVQASFNAAAETYDDHAILQRTVTDRLLESFDHIRVEPELILDLGSGTGYGARALARRFKKAQVHQLDLSEKMLAISRHQSRSLFSRQHYLCAGVEHLPVSDNSADLIFSSLMLQWCNDLDRVFSEIRRVLKNGGVFVFASFGPDTLKELRESWRRVDENIHTNVFIDMHDVGDALIRAGLDAPVLSVEHLTMTYDECFQLMHDLKSIGAHNVNDGRRKTLTGKHRMQAMMQHYESFRRIKKLPATY